MAVGKRKREPAKSYEKVVSDTLTKRFLLNREQKRCTGL